MKKVLILSFMSLIATVSVTAQNTESTKKVTAKKQTEIKEVTTIDKAKIKPAVKLNNAKVNKSIQPVSKEEEVKEIETKQK